MGFPSTIYRLLGACSSASACEDINSEEKATESYQKYIQSLETPDINDFDAVIAHYCDAVDVRYENDPTYLPTTLNIASDVWNSYEKGGRNPAVLPEVVCIHEDAFKRCEYADTKSEGYIRLLINLGKAYCILSDTNKAECTSALLKSVEYLECALAFSKEHPGPNSQDDNTEASLTLGIASWRLCELERRDIGLDLVINRLSAAYHCQGGLSEFSFSNPLPDSQNLASAVQYLHEVIDRSPPSTQLRDASLYHLCQALLLRYELKAKGSSKRHDLIRAEAVARTSMPIVSQDIHVKFKDTLIVITDWKDQAAHAGSLHTKPSPSPVGLPGVRMDFRLGGCAFSTSRAPRTLPNPTSQVIFTTWALSAHPNTRIQKSSKPIAFAQSIGHRVSPPNRKPRAARKWSLSGRSIVSANSQSQLSFGSSYHALTTHTRVRRL
ncbi:hypothetical protein CVT25_004824 [Psilocybe cyanescens]|uniref:Uncharacterized protein n=1 Tax=Psilocybe cyanescens TaxID=93625 RepID=A0A409VZS0_PSICY|nr:hypothetical protein CVT25_004824 [Psilocybe cyanescens]